VATESWWSLGWVHGARTADRIISKERLGSPHLSRRPDHYSCPLHPKARSNPVKLAREISWGTIILVAGLFVMVDAVESIGALKLTQTWLEWAQNLAPATGALITGFAVGIGNNLINNLAAGADCRRHPAGRSRQRSDRHRVLIGVDLGPNLSVTGSLATILWLLALRKEKLDVSFCVSSRFGAVAMPVALLLSLGGAIVMQMVFAHK